MVVKGFFPSQKFSKLFFSFLVQKIAFKNIYHTLEDFSKFNLPFKSTVGRNWLKLTFPSANSKSDPKVIIWVWAKLVVWLLSYKSLLHAPTKKIKICFIINLWYEICRPQILFFILAREALCLLHAFHFQTLRTRLSTIVRTDSGLWYCPCPSVLLDMRLGCIEEF